MCHAYGGYQGCPSGSYSHLLRFLVNLMENIEGNEHEEDPYGVNSPSSFLVEELIGLAELVEKGVNLQDVSEIVRAIRLTLRLRNKLNDSIVSWFIDFILKSGYEKHSDKYYCHFLRVLNFFYQERYLEATMIAHLCLKYIKENRSIVPQTVDVLLVKIYFYYSLCNERMGTLSKIRRKLHDLHQIATLRHDEFGQELLLNLLLRNYIHYGLYDFAEKLRSKAPKLKSNSNLGLNCFRHMQYCRYMFYIGKIKTVQLEYTNAKECLLQALRKAPVSALGFRIQCIKWAALARILLGEIPESSFFMLKQTGKALRPYYEITNAVRIGDLEMLKKVSEKYASTFTLDKTNNLIVRLRHCVIRTGLCNISISYSRISLADIARILRLDSADVEYIVMKAIRDGVIDAKVDHGNGWMITKAATGDNIRSIWETQAALNEGIMYCLNLHNEATQAFRYPRETIFECKQCGTEWIVIYLS